LISATKYPRPCIVTSITKSTISSFCVYTSNPNRSMIMSRRDPAWKEDSMRIRVVFNDNICDMIPDFILQLGIACNKIKMFYRSSEKRWIVVDTDPIRIADQVVAPYTGPERRDPRILDGPSLADKDRIPILRN
jgi:hypothetical protein